MALIDNDIVPENLVDQQHDYPCLECLSDTQLWMVIFVVLNFLYNSLNQTDKTPTERLQDMGCNNCLSDKQTLQAVASKLLYEAANLGYTAQAGLDDAKCVLCADQKRIRTAVAALASGLVGVQIVL